MTHKGTVTLETERLILRRFMINDAEPMFCNWASDPEDITIDCIDPIRTRDFYTNLTGWEKCEAYDCSALIGDKGLLILFAVLEVDYVPPVWPEEYGKQQKQMHFNFQVDDLHAFMNEAFRLGATKAAEQFGGDDFVTMLDPEGHPFCLCAK